MRARCEPKHNMPHTVRAPLLFYTKIGLPSLQIGKKDLSPLGDKESPRADL